MVMETVVTIDAKTGIKVVKEVVRPICDTPVEPPKFEVDMKDLVALINYAKAQEWI